ncbi:MAG: DNA adenine methylase [Phototrophicaceae bacterium]
MESLTPTTTIPPLKSQFLKWIGNKQRFAHEIIGYFPRDFKMYYEPFIGSGAILGTLFPKRGVAGDSLQPLIQIWQTLQQQPEIVEEWYLERWLQFNGNDRTVAYNAIKRSFNVQPNPADLLFLSRSCYGGVVRFRKDGYMSTPCGVHDPIHPSRFAERVKVWHERVQGVEFLHDDFEATMKLAQRGDLIYCDPPYSDTQSIIYGSQQFSLMRLLSVIEDCKSRGVYVALSIDGTKHNGRKRPQLQIPAGLFEQEIVVNCGRSMLKRFQMTGQTLEDEVVTDRLLLSYSP